MRTGIFVILLFLIAGCSGNLSLDPITSENGLAFTASRDIFSHITEDAEQVTESDLVYDWIEEDCPSDPLELEHR